MPKVAPSENLIILIALIKDSYGAGDTARFCFGMGPPTQIFAGHYGYVTLATGYCRNVRGILRARKQPSQGAAFLNT